MTEHPPKRTTPKPLHEIFTSVPPRYDLINQLMTWGMDRRWRRVAARECLAAQPEKVLDLACGTGDLAINIARMTNGRVEVIGLDYSPPMLEIAEKKAARFNITMPFIHGDAANLPFADGYFDCVGISFAFRNLTYKNPLSQRYLAEILRVIKPGGRFVIVESSQPRNRMIRSLFHVYLRLFAYRLGSLVSGKKTAYRYLSESAARFYNPEELGNLLLTTGFSKISYRPLFFGAAGVTVAVK